MKSIFMVLVLALVFVRSVVAFEYVEHDNTYNIDCTTSLGIIRFNMDNPAGSSNFLSPSAVRLVSFNESDFGSLAATQMYLKSIDHPILGYGNALSALFVDDQANIVADFDAAAELIDLNGIVLQGLCLLPTGE
jgi:hypothetical protein